ncbi:MAG TPA: glycosyltransferase, partial [Gemmatimonadaceae bacterium]|nr:glycosyltransferase [Gemmatimonadaceae bacterium]
EIAALGIGSLVKWAGYLPDESLSRVLSGAIALALPSECEGFGLPAVEAAACGTAVIATTESPLPQLLEGGGIFVDPADEDALTEAILRLAVDESLQSSMGAKAMERAHALSWDDAARAALRAIREAA